MEIVEIKQQLSIITVLEYYRIVDACEYIYEYFRKQKEIENRYQ